MSGVTRGDRIRNEYDVRGDFGVASNVVDKISESRPRWFGRVMIRAETEERLGMNVDGKTGRPKNRDGWKQLETV